MSDAHRFTFHASESDWLRAMEQTKRRSRTVRLFYVWMFLLAVLLLWSAVRAEHTLAGALRAVWPTLTVVVGAVLLLMPLSRLSVRAAMRLNRNIVGTKALELDAAGLRWIAPGMHADVPWPKIRQVWESADFLFFRQSATRTFFLPKADVSEDKLAELRAFLLAHAGHAATGLQQGPAARAG